VPRDPTLSVDTNYVMAAAGLLATLDPDAAALLLQRELAVSPARHSVQ
jgi:hypothetical protein